MEKFRTLIVDDDALILELMKHVTRKHPILEVEATTSSAQAIQRIQENPPYHIILADLVMPEYSGMDVMRAARNRSPDTRGIMVTGFGDKELTAEAIKLGLSDYLRKPFRNEELDLAVRNAIVHFKQIGAIFENKKTLEKKQLTLQRLSDREQEIAQRLRPLKDQAEALARSKQEAEALATRLTQVRNAGRGDAAISITARLNDLGQLLSDRQITEEEFNHVRKSLLEKAYKRPIGT